MDKDNYLFGMERLRYRAVREDLNGVERYVIYKGKANVNYAFISYIPIKSHDDFIDMVTSLLPKRDIYRKYRNLFNVVGSVDDEIVLTFVPPIDTPDDYPEKKKVYWSMSNPHG